MHEPLSNLRPVIFVQFARGAPRTEVWRGLHGAATLRADCGKIVIAVSEDIDPESTDAVFWSLAYRSTPTEDVHDRAVPPRRAGLAVRPGPVRIDDADRRHAEVPDGAARAADPRVHGRRARDLGGARAAGAHRRSRRGTATRSATGPIPGSASRSARRAGEWEQNGIETLARQRGATSTPETPVRQSREARLSRSLHVHRLHRSRVRTVKPAPFTYHDPRTVAEACDLLATRENARVLAGGQSLMPMMNFRFAMPDHLIDLNRIGELAYLRVDRRARCEVGAMTRQRDLEFSAEVGRALPDPARGARARRAPPDAQPRHARRIAVPSRSVRGARRT